MFPYIQGILAFDTPYLGISPGVIAYGAEGHYNTASTALTQISGLVGGFWGAKAAGAAGATQNRQEPDNRKPKALLPAPSSSTPPTEGNAGAAAAAAATAHANAAVDGSNRNGSSDAAATPAWQRWGKVAMFAGAAGAVAAGGAAAYLKREQISESWSWVGSHLEFVGCLMRGEELKTRLSRVVELSSRGLGFADLYTVLGKGAESAPVAAGGIARKGYSSAIVGPERTFCSLPKTEKLRGFFIGQVNDAAKDETWAHMSRFHSTT